LRILAAAFSIEVAEGTNGLRESPPFSDGGNRKPIPRAKWSKNCCNHQWSVRYVRVGHRVIPPGTLATHGRAECCWFPSRARARFRPRKFLSTVQRGITLVGVLGMVTRKLICSLHDMAADGSRSAVIAQKGPGLYIRGPEPFCESPTGSTPGADVLRGTRSWS
jgi:hypothetical protein